MLPKVICQGNPGARLFGLLRTPWPGQPQDHPASGPCDASRLFSQVPLAESADMALEARVPEGNHQFLNTGPMLLSAATL
jgi:hypothetical protein